MNIVKDGDKITHNGRVYTYTTSWLDGEAHTYLQASYGSGAPEIVCPKCFADSFQISFGDYECFANCKCGHKMSIYSG